ncbi:MAG TPA: HlyC/CorC family transporter [Acholeplasmataceae bacterium]|nr:HlyC/CorC family transporter [Acholeplasmataceae bacterium]
MVPPELCFILNINFLIEKPGLNIFLFFLFILLFIFSAFISKAEAVFSSVNIIRIRNYLEEKKKGAKKAVYISEKYDTTLTTLLIVNILLKISLVILAGYFVFNLLENFWLSVIVIIFLIPTLMLIFTEIIPRAKGQIAPEIKALKYSGFLYFIIKLLAPITYLYVRMRKSIMEKNDLLDNPKVTEEELESIIDVMETEGVFEENDAEMIQNAISLSETTVYDIMTPRVDVVAVEISSSIEDIKNMFFEYQFSRVPVYREDKDNIIGILSEKDFFTALLKGEKIELEKMLSEPYYVSKTTKVNELIKELQRLQKHFAIVVDDYGGTSGIVTMEDALEEIVGEIYDEYDDVEEEELIKLEEGKYHVKPEMDLEELFEILELGDAPESQFSSVGGFVYGLCEGMPFEGQIVTYRHHVEIITEDEEKEITYFLSFTISKFTNRRIRDLVLEITENQND